MKLELIKEVKSNGDIYYSVTRDDIYVSDSLVYAGVVGKEYEGADQRAIDKFNLVKNCNNVDRITVILSEEIIENNENN